MLRVTGPLPQNLVDIDESGRLLEPRQCMDAGPKLYPDGRARRGGMARSAEAAPGPSSWAASAVWPGSGENLHKKGEAPSARTRGPCNVLRRVLLTPPGPVYLKTSRPDGSTRPKATDPPDPSANRLSGPCDQRPEDRKPRHHDPSDRFWPQYEKRAPMPIFCA